MPFHIYLGLVVLFVLFVRKLNKLNHIPQKGIVGNHANGSFQSAEIHGAAWESNSIFEHIERGLTKNTGAIAVISLFQPANHLGNLGIEGHNATHGSSQVPEVEHTIASNGLWEKKQSQHHEGWIHNNPREVHEYRNGRMSSQKSLNGHGPNGHVPNDYLDGHSHDCDNSDDKDDLPLAVNGHPGHHNHLATPCLPNGNSGLSGPSDIVTSGNHLTLTYKQLHTTATALAAGFLVDGVSQNTTMVMLIPNGAEYTLLLYTCVLLRITYVFLDPSLLDISGFTMFKHFMRTLKPQIVVAPDTATGRAVDVAVSELQLPPPKLVSLFDTTGSPSWGSLADLATRGRKAIAGGAVSEVTLIDEARRDSAGRIHSIMFTSGTSGLPKGCPLRVGGMSHALSSQSWLLEDNDGHNGGHCPPSGPPVRALMQPHNSRGIAPAQTLQTWRAGGSVVLTGQTFDVREAISAITRVRATFIVLTPPMVHEMADTLAANPGLDVASVRTVQVGGDTVTKGLLQCCQRLFPSARVLVNHGMTEGPGAFMWPSRFSPLPAGQLPFYGESVCPVGSVAPGAAVRICDADNGSACVLARGEVGEMHVSCPSIIGHYWNGRSDQSFYSDADGQRWFKTGDAALVDDEGVVFVVGRVKDIIRRAGIYIMPAPIESLIEEFTGAQTVVVPVRHHALGAEPFAVISSYNGKDASRIKERVRAVFGKDCSLGGVATLKQLGLERFPLNATHKVVKSKVIEIVDFHVNTVSNGP